MKLAIELLHAALRDHRQMNQADSGYLERLPHGPDWDQMRESVAARKEYREHVIVDIEDALEVLVLGT